MKPASQRPYRALFENVWGQQAFVIAWPSDVDQVCSRPGPPSASDPLPVHLSDVDRGRAGATFDQMAGSVLPIDPSYWFHTVATSAMVSAAEMERHPWMPRARRFRRFHVKINDHRLLPASHHDRLANVVWTSVDLLMRHVRRHINKISRPGFFAQFQVIAPSHSHPALHHV